MNNRIDFEKIFHCLPQITGFEWTRKGKHYISNHYMDGRVSSRPDKLVATLGSNKQGVQILENGGETTTLFRWLRDYSGCNSDKEVLRVLSFDTSAVFVPLTSPELSSRYVNPNEVKRGDLRHCNLFNYLCTVFDRKRVVHAFNMFDVYPVWNKYAGWVTTFLYKDEEGRICFDKQIKYLPTGKRDKSFGGNRFFTTAKGYRHKTYFGNHLWGKENEKPIYITESEKSCMIFWLRYNKPSMACGGSNCLRDIKPNYVLLPDKDLAGTTWIDKHQNNCVKWWDAVPDYDAPDGSDFADFILFKKQNRNEKII